jgi:SAM-dependent methyltransferase
MSKVRSANAVEGGVESVFDSPVTRQLNDACWDFFAPFIRELKETLNLQHALDVGAGAGYFSRKLADAGLAVTAIDGRAENVEVIRTRHPDVATAIVDVQRANVLAQFSSCDFILCTGLLYHLDNPLAAIRNLAELPAPVALIETQIVDTAVAEFRLVEEGRSPSQGLSHIGLIPSRPAITRLFHRFGRPFIYEFEHRPQHPDFTHDLWRRTLRYAFCASRQPLAITGLKPVTPAPAGKGFHQKAPAVALSRVRKFARRWRAPHAL